MMLRPGSLASRLSALGLLGIVLLVLWLTVVVPYRDLLEGLDDDIEAAALRVEGFKRAASNFEADRLRVTAATTEFAQRRWVYRGTKPDVAGATLQQALTDLIRNKGGQMRTLQGQPPSPSGPVTQISLVLQFAISMDGLLDVLVALEQQRPLVIVQELSVRVNQGQFSRRQVDSAALQLPFRDEAVLEVTLRVAGFVLEGDPP